MPWLIAGGVLFVIVFAVGVRQIRKNLWLRRSAQTPVAPLGKIVVEESTPAQITSNQEQSQFEPPFPEERQVFVNSVATAMRSMLSDSELLDLINLVYAMAGFGPSTANPRIREGAQAVLKSDGDYLAFVRQFKTFASIPEHYNLDSRPIEQVSALSHAELVYDEELLVTLMKFAPQIDDFYWNRYQMLPNNERSLEFDSDMVITVEVLRKLHHSNSRI